MSKIFFDAAQDEHATVRKAIIKFVGYLLDLKADKMGYNMEEILSWVAKMANDESVAVRKKHIQ